MKTLTAQSPTSLMKMTSLCTISVASLFLAGCGGFTNNGASVSFSSSASTGTTTASAAGGGATVAGTGALSVPTANAVVARVQNGLEQNAVASAGNFAKFYAQVKVNLPKVTDPTKATGYDQIQLLSFGACSDLVSGKTPLMMSKYNVNPATSVTANQAALVAAGVRIMDQYTAGLGSSGPAASQVSSIFTSLVQQSASVSTNTSTIAFMTVCTAANSAGASLLGF